MPPPNRMHVAVVGATGVVGVTMARVLEERRFPVGEYSPLATDTRTDRAVEAFGRRWKVEVAEDFDFSTVDIALFTAGAGVSRALVPRAIDAGARVVDNTTAFRMDEGVPLVVPEINGGVVGPGTRLVSCPNCTAVILVMTLGPILRETEIERVIVTSFQSVSGAGKEALEELERQARNELEIPRVFPKPIAFNCLPLVGKLLESGYTVEEEKIIEESRKILERGTLVVVPTAVRVPVRIGHSISVSLELFGDVEPVRCAELWSNAGIKVNEEVPTPLEIAGTDDIVVGRVRWDPSRPWSLSYWAVGDNLRKGAATNSIQIAELLLSSMHDD